MLVRVIKHCAMSGGDNLLNCLDILDNVEYHIGNGQLSVVTWSAHIIMGRYLANAIVSDKSK